MSLHVGVDYALGTGPDPSAPSPGIRESSGLTHRQLDIARLVAGGLTNRQIAASLNISERTVEAHQDQIRNKLGLRSRAQIAAWCVRNDPT